MMTGIVLFLCCIFLSAVPIKLATAALQYVPPSRNIDIIEQQNYIFGVEEDGVSTNITKCYYSTDTGIAGSFDVVKYRKPLEPTKNVFSDYNAKAEHNIVSDYGNLASCQIGVEAIDDKGPKKWTIIPYDEFTKKNLSIITYNVNFFYKIPLLMDRIFVVESASFLQYLKTNIPFSTCKLNFDGTEIDLPLHSTKASTFLAPYSLENEKVAGKISALGQGLCGFVLDNATPSDTLQWTLTAVDERGHPYRAIFESSVSKKLSDTVFHTKTEVIVGTSARVSCGDKFNHLFCIMYNPKGQLIPSTELTECSYSPKTVTMEDLGTWKCFAGVQGKTMESVYYTVELVQIGSEVVETWVNETESYVTIGCQINNVSDPSISFCKLTAPNNRIFNLQTGFATSRYLTIGTDFKKGVCEMQIKKPLEEFEYGLWRCEINRVGSITGGFIKLTNGDDKYVITVPEYPNEIQLTTQLGQPFTIYCEVPYSSEYCSIKSPNGTIYPTKNDQETHLGRCMYEKLKSDAADNGTWSCSFARETGLPDEVISVQVTIGEVLAYYKTTEVDSGVDANLMCSSGGLPLKYCRFISPNSTSYYIHNHQKSDGLSYYGKGLEYGECGITIPRAQASDSGVWTCITRIGGYDQDEILAYMSLNVSPNLLDDPNLATGIGIAVGVVVVSAIIGVVAVRRWKRRSHTEIANSSTAPRRINDGDNLSSNSETDIFSLGSTVRSYTNPITVTDEQREHERAHEHQL